MIRSLTRIVAGPLLPVRPDGEAGATNLPNLGRLRFAHRSGAPSGLSRFASQAKPLLTIAGELLVIFGLVMLAVMA